MSVIKNINTMKNWYHVQFNKCSCVSKYVARAQQATAHVFLNVPTSPFCICLEFNMYFLTEQNWQESVTAVKYHALKRSEHCCSL